MKTFPAGRGRRRRRHSKVRKHYTIVSGTGRAGTTLLMRVLTRAGVNTGFSVHDMDRQIDPISHAGLEADLRQRPQAYVVKSPFIAQYLNEVIEADDIAIDHAIICMRDLFSAAESRRRVQGLHDMPPYPAVGGLWDVLEPQKQEAVLADVFYRLIQTLVAHDVPMTFLHFRALPSTDATRYASSAPYFPTSGEANGAPPLKPKCSRG